MTTQAPASSLPGQASGLLARSVQAGTYEAPTWVEVPLGDMTITVAADNLKAVPDGSTSPLRLPVTWPETYAIAQAMGAALGEDIIAPSQKIADAIYRAATTMTVLHGQGTGAMIALATSENYNRDIDQQIAQKGGAAGGLVSGHEKYWILHPRLDQAVNDATLRASGLPPVGPNPAVNYGGWGPDGKPIQTVGGRHNAAHVDYSQLLRPVKRWARKADGTKVDLLAWIEANEGVPSRFTDLFRPQLVA
jgi:hypothetical protein